MDAIFSIIIPVLIFAAAMALLILPLEWAAKAMGAKRTSWGWCLLALIGASLLQLIGSSVPVAGNIVAFLLSALAFAAILETNFLRGIAIALLHIIFLIVLVLLTLLLFGAGITGFSRFGPG